MTKLDWKNELNNPSSDKIGFKLPVTIFETIELYKAESDRLVLLWDYSKLPSWLLINLKNRNCKWYCINNTWLPIVCGKLDLCNNFSRAGTILSSINYQEYLDTIWDIY